MGLRWRKSIGGSKGPRLNLSLRGLGLSFGTRGLRLGIGRRGPTVSAGIPGTGLYYFKTIGRGRAGRAPRQPIEPPPLPQRQAAPQTFRPAPAMTREEIDALNAKQRPFLIGLGVLLLAVLLIAGIASVFERQPVNRTPPPPPPTAPAPKVEAESVSLAPRTIYQATAPIPLYNVPSSATVAYTLAAGGFLTTMETPRGGSLFQKVSLSDGQINFTYYMDTGALKTGQLIAFVPPQPRAVARDEGDVSRSTPIVSAPSQNVSSDTVFITPNGEKYHRADCVTLHGSGKAMSRSDAIRAGYGPCKRCKS